MKLKVASSVKGEISVQPLGRGFRAGEEFHLNEDQCKDIGVQNALKDGMFLSDEASIIKSSLVEFRNLTTNHLVLGGNGISVPGNYKFSVSGEVANSSIIQDAVSKGFIALESDFQKKMKGKKKKTTKIKKEEKPEGILEAEERLNKLSSVPSGMYVVKNPADEASQRIDTLMADLEAEGKGSGSNVAFADKKQTAEKLGKLYKKSNKGAS